MGVCPPWQPILALSLPYYQVCYQLYSQPCCQQLRLAGLLILACCQQLTQACLQQLILDVNQLLNLAEILKSDSI